MAMATSNKVRTNTRNEEEEDSTFWSNVNIQCSYHNNRQHIISDSVAAIIIIVVPTAANESAILLFYLFTEINALVLRVYKIGFK